MSYSDGNLEVLWAQKPVQSRAVFRDQGLKPPEKILLFCKKSEKARFVIYFFRENLIISCCNVLSEKDAVGTSWSHNLTTCEHFKPWHILKDTIKLTGSFATMPQWPWHSNKGHMKC